MPKKNINRLLKDTFYIVCKKPKELNMQPIEHKGNKLKQKILQYFVPNII